MKPASVVSVVEPVEELNFAVPRRGMRRVAARDDLLWPGDRSDGERPDAVGDGESCGRWFAVDFEDEEFPGIKDDAAGLVVEAASSLGCGDRQDQICAMVAGPGVTRELEAQSDAATPVGGIYSYAMDHGYVLDDAAACVLVGTKRRVVGFLHVWSDERRTYDGLVAARHYQFPVQAVLALDGEAWQRYGARIADLLAKEATGPLYVFLRSRDADDYPRARFMPRGAEAEQQASHGDSHGDIVEARRPGLKGAQAEQSAGGVR